MDAATFFDLKREIVERGYADEVTWAETVGPCTSALDFAREHAFVVCNSGMRAQTAVTIFRWVWQALERGDELSSVFLHAGKCEAMQYVYDNRERLFGEYRKLESDEEKIEFLGRLPWIGDITKFHLAKNFGVDCCKPDRHLVRIAASYGTTPDGLCRRLAEETGNNVNTVDYVIWRAANLGLI